MPIRLMQIILPANVSKTDIPSLLGEKEIISGWSSDYPDSKTILHLLIPAEDCDSVIDKFEQRFASTSGYNIILLPVEAFLPRPKPDDKKDEVEAEEKEPPKPNVHRVSREELYSEINEGIKISHTFLAMTVLSAIVAAVGLIRNDVAVIIGAMVIAPLLTPNVALALSTTLGDTDLLRRSLKNSITGLSTAIVLSMIIGLVLHIDPSVPAIASRTRIGISDVVLALASGSAGILAFTSGASGALIGVMVAVALMPPLVTFGMLLGSGYTALAAKALFLVITNIICINLAGVGTFLVQGVRPQTWWEAEKARKSAKIAALSWGILLVILVIIILLDKKYLISY